MNDIITPTNAAKAVALLLLVHGTFHALAPGPTVLKYKVPSNDDDMYNISIRSIGVSLIFTSSIVLSLVFQEETNDKDRYAAYALATSFWFIEHLTRVLNKESTKKGGSDVPNAVLAAINAGMVYASFNEEWWKVGAMVLMSCILFFGLSLTFLTKQLVCQMWRYDEKLFEDSKHGPYVFFISRSVGIAMIQSGVLVGALELGKMEPERAFGVSCIVLIVGNILVLLVSNLPDRSLMVRQLAMAAAGAVATLVMLLGTAPAVDEASAKE